MVQVTEMATTDRDYQRWLAGPASVTRRMLEALMTHVRESGRQPAPFLFSSRRGGQAVAIPPRNTRSANSTSARLPIYSGVR